MNYTELAVLHRWQQIAINLLAHDIARYFTEEYGYAQPTISLGRFKNGSPMAIMTWHLFNQIDQEMVFTVSENTVIITPRVIFGGQIVFGDCLIRHDVTDPNPFEDEGFIYHLGRINNKFSHYSNPAAVAN